jgi:hypothetical protein
LAKNDTEIETVVINAAELGEWIAVSPRQVYVLEKKNLVVRSGKGFDRTRSTRRYIGHLLARLRAVGSGSLGRPQQVRVLPLAPAVSLRRWFTLRHLARKTKPRGNGNFGQSPAESLHWPAAHSPPARLLQNLMAQREFQSTLI